MRAFVIALGLVALSSPFALQAQSPTDNPEAAARTLTQRLLSAMSHRDFDALAALFRFPASVRAGGVTLPMGNRTALEKAFETVFTPELGCALERSLQPGGDAVRKEGDGLSIGRGAVHLQPSGASFAITRIDEPSGAAPAAPRAPPRRVDVPAGQVQFAGTLAVGGADRYLVSVRQGDVLQARIERFQGRAIGVRVVDAKSRRVLSTGADTARTISVTAPQAGDVAVEVTRLTFCEPSETYLLTLNKRR
jgi:hypothetical protein